MSLVSSKQKIMGRNNDLSSFGGHREARQPLTLLSSLPLQPSPASQWPQPRCQELTYYPQLPNKAFLPHALLSQITYLSSSNPVKTHFHDLVPSYLFSFITHYSPICNKQNHPLVPKLAKLSLFCIYAPAIFCMQCISPKIHLPTNHK